MSKMLVKENNPLSLKWGKRPSDRNMQELLDAAVINMDKPMGPTSHQATAWVRDALGIERIGHGGTLDPKVSGVLPVATGRATRALDLVLRSDKEYVALMRLHRDRKEEDIRGVMTTCSSDLSIRPRPFDLRSSVRCAYEGSIP